MDPISLITGALAAGAVPALKDAAGQAIKDAYSGLKALIKKRFEEKKDAKGEMVLTEYESDHETWEKPLQKALAQAEADKDEAIIKTAQKIMELLQPKQAAMGKFNIQAENSQIGAIGDNTRIEGGIHFGSKL